VLLTARTTQNKLSVVKDSSWNIRQLLLVAESTTLAIAVVSRGEVRPSDAYDQK
jgi:hypothetical protein